MGALGGIWTRRPGSRSSQGIRAGEAHFEEWRPCTMAAEQELST